MPEHVDIRPPNNHGIESFVEVETTEALAALGATLKATDRGKVVYLTGAPTGWYIWMGAGWAVLTPSVLAAMNNFTSAADPTPTDDVDSGYNVGSRWTNTATGEVWDCIDATVGAAIWVTTGRVIREEPSGFVQSGSDSGTMMTFDDVTRTFTIAPTGASFDVWVAGRKFVKSGPESIVWSDVEGPHFFGYDTDGNLETLVPPDLPDDWVEGGGAYLAVILWDFDNKISLIRGEERHGLMDGETHSHFHSAFGTQWVSGGELIDIQADQSGDDDAHAQFAVEDAIYRDEDITHNTTGLDTAPASIPIFYRVGAAGLWRRKAPDAFPLIYDGTAGFSGSGRPAWNEFTGAVWQLTEITNNDYFLVHYLLTNDLTYGHGVIGIQGQGRYTTKNNAEEGALTEVKNLSLGSLAGLVRESVFVGTVIFRGSDGQANTPKARIETTDFGSDYVDWRLIHGLSFAR